ncbi:hypothetical protein DY000_02041747 [Brassica cretica]|uniref:Amine oxidase domain-containing protein n=1 Tax=Brassica cretica TaxID=69181 RepID=A0ABQ7B9W3_BRACR|nr:hypothetical protein DY000_02041747 [Brassica cretica]
MRVAVIGGGISGLGSAYVLAKEYGIEEVVLFEKEESLGGHAKTVRFDDVDFDIGFIVFNTVRTLVSSALLLFGIVIKRNHFSHPNLGDIVAKIADIRRLASRFPSLSAFTASELGLLFSQLFLFVPIEDFLLFCHWFVERRAFPSESASGPPWMSVDVLISIVGDIARIQVDVLDSVVLRSLHGRRRTFRVSLFDGRFLARVLTRRSFLRGSRPVEWGCQVESFPVDFSGSAGADWLSPCR